MEIASLSTKLSLSQLLPLHICLLWVQLVTSSRCYPVSAMIFLFIVVVLLHFIFLAFSHYCIFHFAVIWCYLREPLYLFTPLSLSELHHRFSSLPHISKKPVHSRGLYWERRASGNLSFWTKSFDPFNNLSWCKPEPVGAMMQKELRPRLRRGGTPSPTQPPQAQLAYLAQLRAMSSCTSCPSSLACNKLNNKF